jgi:hypothetical protein
LAELDVANAILLTFYRLYVYVIPIICMIVLRIQNAVADNIMTTIFIKNNDNDKLIQITINSSSQAQEEKKNINSWKEKPKRAW